MQLGFHLIDCYIRSPAFTQVPAEHGYQHRSAPFFAIGGAWVVINRMIVESAKPSKNEAVNFPLDLIDLGGMNAAADAMVTPFIPSTDFFYIVHFR